jgi:hypothetical protein
MAHRPRADRALISQNNLTFHHPAAEPPLSWIRAFCNNKLLEVAFKNSKHFVHFIALSKLTSNKPPGYASDLPAKAETALG